MKGANSSVADNVTDVTKTTDSTVSLTETVTQPSLTLTRNPEYQEFSLGIPLIGLIISIIGSLANTVVLTVLTLARRQYGKNVNTLIINQSAMDLFACVSVVTVYVVMLTRGVVYRGNQIIDTISCVVLQSGLCADIGLAAGKFGLVVITLERYFKIAHAVAHRKNHRNWMTKVGVAWPWIGSMCLVLFPSIGTTRIVNGSCLKYGVWPKKVMKKVRNNSISLQH